MSEQTQTLDALAPPTLWHDPKRTSQQRQLEGVAKAGWKLTPATCAYRLTRGRWIPARHLLYLSKIIATEIAKGDGRILVMSPPRHGKSEFISIRTPIWFLEKYPEKNTITCTFSADLAVEFAVKVRDAFMNEENHDLLTTRIRTDRKRVDSFMTTDGGRATSVGIGGVLTGRGADLLIIDDYVKNAEESLSESQLRKTWEWFKSTAYTRLEPGATLIILATRWSQNDLIGMCRKELPHEKWTIIRLPAIAEVGDPLDRVPGEALWPERFPVEVLNRIKLSMGSYWFDAEYQQSPRASMSEIALGDAIKVVKPTQIPADMRYIRAWDLAGTEGEGDWSVGVKMGREMSNFHAGGMVYITDIQRFRKSPHGNEIHIREVAEMDGVGCEIIMEQEPGSSGITVIQNYSLKILHNFAFSGERATGPVEIRAQPFLAACEAGRLCMVEAEWNQALRDEINAFPDGEHDDQPVACALGYNRLVGRNKQGLTWGANSWVDESKHTTKAPLGERNVQRRSGLTW